MNNLISISTIVGIVLGVLSLIAGVICIIVFARTRKRVFLIVGLVLTFVFPGLVLCALLAIWIPSIMIVYAPPPPNMRP